MRDDDVTLGEVGRRVSDLAAAQRDLTAKVTTLLTRDAADLQRMNHLGSRVTRLENGALWLIGVIAVIIIGAGMSGILK